MFITCRLQVSFKLLFFLSLTLASLPGAAAIAASRQATPVPTPELAASAGQSRPLVLTTEIKARTPWRIAFVPKEKFYVKTGNLGAYWQPAWEGASRAGKDFGVNVELAAVTALCETDVECIEPQIRVIAELIECGGIDGIVMAPLDTNRLAPVVNKAIAAGIPTIVMDTPLNSNQVLTFVVFDNFAAGQIMGEWIVEQLGGPGKALILEGPPDQQNAIDRRSGFLAGLRNGKIDVLDTQSADWEIEPAKEITTSWLREFPHINVILAANDDMAIGAAEAVTKAKRQDIIITGFDATEVGLKAIQNGKMAATIDQAPALQARLAIQLLIRHLETGETFPSPIMLPHIPVVTRQNIEDYLSKLPDN